MVHRHHETAEIYALVDETGRPRYVGNSWSAKTRIKAHWQNRHTNKNNIAFAQWLLSLGERPEAKILDTVPYAERYAAEKRWTDRLRAEGVDLFNINSGASHGAQTREKMAAAWDYPEERERRREIARRRYESPEARAKAAERCREILASPEVRAKLSAASRRQVWTPERRAKIAEANRRRVISTETRTKLAEASRKRGVSPESRAKISEAAQLRYQDPEYRAKMAAAIRAAYAAKRGPTQTAPK